MLGSYRVASQLVVSRVVLSSTELIRITAQNPAAVYCISCVSDGASPRGSDVCCYIIVREQILFSTHARPISQEQGVSGSDCLNIAPGRLGRVWNYSSTHYRLS
jgi:hypothetical protein